MRNRTRLSRGFTLIETLIALAIITMISLVVMGALAPWLGLKQKMDTERRLQDIQQGLQAVYNRKAMSIDQEAAGAFDQFLTSNPTNGRCALQVAAFAADSDAFSEAPLQLSRDGWTQPWCIFITTPTSIAQDGVTVWYRNIIVISTGRNGVLDAGTQLMPNGTFVTGGDDLGVIVSGKDIEIAKLKETQRRLTKVAQMYETYFTTRYLANAARDVTIDYFSNLYDSGGSVVSTGGAWAPAGTVLSAVGAGGADVYSSWETNNTIELGNANESVGGVTARSPATSGTGVLPYTALLRAAVPAPSGQTSYATQVVVGGY